MGLPLEVLSWKVVNWSLSNKTPLVTNPCKWYQCISLTKWRPMGCLLSNRTPFCDWYTLICMGMLAGALIWKVVNHWLLLWQTQANNISVYRSQNGDDVFWPLSKSAPLVGDPCRLVYIAHNMAGSVRIAIACVAQN